jgi:LysR family transcriptional regulator, glycine cleavage system transcriptional activator
MRNLAMLRAIQAFEAAARHQNYAAAATELNVTPAAIGQQVRALEAWVGSALFHRLSAGANRLVLSESALAALPDFVEGLDRLDAGLRRLRNERQASLITVSASQAFVARWLLPRLESFTSARPDIDVRLDVSDRLSDIEHGQADLAIRCGAGKWPGVTSTRLMDEEVFPVCSPALLADRAAPRTAKQLATMTLIHDLTLAPLKAFPSWTQWLHAQGAKPTNASRGLHINASAAVIQAALSGQGVALARRAFVANDLADGRLLRLLPHIRWPIAWAYHLVHTDTALRREPLRAFVAWLKDETSQRPVATEGNSAGLSTLRR